MASVDAVMVASVKATVQALRAWTGIWIFHIQWVMFLTFFVYVDVNISTDRRIDGCGVVQINHTPTPPLTYQELGATSLSNPSDWQNHQGGAEGLPTVL